jgi:hypothetical protein
MTLFTLVEGMHSCIEDIQGFFYLFFKLQLVYSGWQLVCVGRLNSSCWVPDAPAVFRQVLEFDRI